MNRVRRTSVVVRVTQDQRGDIRGVVERVATGAKESFTGLETVGRVITQMLPAETTTGASPRRSPGEAP